VWIFLAMVAAVGTALRDVATKQAVRGADPLLVAFALAGVPTVLLGAVVLAMGPAPPTDGFWLALLVSGGINAVATPLIVFALQRSDLSLVAPLTSLTPLFMLGTGAVVLGEVPGPIGVVGVITIVAGAWILALPARHEGVLAPFRAVLRDPGARAMLVVAALYSVSATYDKVGTQASSPLLWAASVNAVVAAVLGAVLAAAVRARRRAAPGSTAPARRPADLAHGTDGAGATVSGRRVVRVMFLAGLLAAAIAAAQMTAILLTLAAYVIAVKRTSTLFGVVLGHLVFGERHVRARLLGAAVMLAGFILLTAVG
jgi:drug/metabolite transporter (DMT)-like permease